MGLDVVADLDVRRAETLGLQYLYESGYDPRGFVAFFERGWKLEKDQRGLIAKAFPSHPLTKDCVAAAEREIERDLPPRREYVVTASASKQVKRRLEQYMRGQMPVISSEPREPVLRGGAKARRFRREDLP